MRTAADYEHLWDDAVAQVTPMFWGTYPNRDFPAAYLSLMVASDAMGAALLLARHRYLRPAYVPEIAEYLARVVALGGSLASAGLPRSVRRRTAQERATQVAAVISQWRDLDADPDAENALDATAGMGTGSDLWWAELLAQHARPMWVSAWTDDTEIPREAAILSAATALCWLGDLYHARRVTKHPYTGRFITYSELAAYKHDMHHQTAN